MSPLSTTMLAVPLAFFATSVACSKGLLSPRQSSSSALVDCLTNAGLKPITSTSNNYTVDVAAFNRRFNPTPTAFISPSTVSEVSSALSCASNTSSTVSTRSGGHSYAAYGLAGQLVVNLVNFQGVQVLKDGVTAKVQGGVKLGDLALALNAKGRGLPHGVCPWVGVGGHASQGGFGMISRLHGLLLDTITAFDVVLANGTYIERMTARQNPDLFFALAGAAPSYGLITAYYFTTFAAPPLSIHFFLSFAGPLPIEKSVSIFKAFQSFSSSSNASIAPPKKMGIELLTDNSGTVTITGVFFSADRASFNKTIKPLLSSLPPQRDERVEEWDWLTLMQKLAGGQNLNTTIDGMDYSDAFYAKSLTTPQGVPLSDEAITSLFTYLNKTETSTNWFVHADLWGGLNSAISNPSHSISSSTSFGRRDSLFAWQFYASSPTYAPPFPNDGITFVNGIHDSITGPMTAEWAKTKAGAGAYVNYADPQLTQREQQTLYWADKYPRLSEVKAAYDPRNIFKFDQGIIAANSSSASDHSVEKHLPTTAFSSSIRQHALPIRALITWVAIASMPFLPTIFI